MQNPLDRTHHSTSTNTNAFLERSIFDGLPLAGMWFSKKEYHVNNAMRSFLQLQKGASFDDVRNRFAEAMTDADFHHLSQVIRHRHSCNNTLRLTLGAQERLVKVRTFEKPDSVVWIFEDVTNEEQREQ